MQFDFFKKTLARFSVASLLVAIATLQGCSDNTASLNNAATPPPPGMATVLQLLVSSQQMLSSSIATTELTAVVLDANGQAVAGEAVTFAKGADSTAFFTNIVGVSDANGIASATLNIGGDMTNRVITVTATAGTAAGSNTVTVAGTKIAISGNTSLALNASSTLTIIVKDSLGVAVPGVSLSIASQNGNPIVLSPATGVTDATGQVTATLTATNAGTGTDVLTVTGAGATQTQTITINSASFKFTAPAVVAPATTPEIVVNAPTPVSILWTNGGAPVVGSAVDFTTSRGTIAATPVVTDATGAATASVTANSTGATIITAAGPGGTPAATLNVVFITTSANSATAQAYPGTVAVNTGGGTTNQSVISVVVRDVNNNLVKNAHINFTQVADVSGGSLAASAATTDITGSASVNYIAGSTTSGQNGVQIDATVDMVNGVPINTPVTSTVYLTVASQALFVRLGTDNKVYPNTPVPGTHTKQYTALVTDSAGNPAPDGTEVRFVLRPAMMTLPSFFKGHYFWNGIKWKQTITTSCVNEDADYDGLLGAGEDINGNGRLDPSGSATVTATATTVSGFAIAQISYAKEFSFWAQMDLEARAGTVGNDPPTVVTVLLEGATDDYGSETVVPPGVVSPFGYGNDLTVDPQTGAPLTLHNFCTDPY